MEKQNNPHTFTPEEVADVIRPYLSVLTIRDKIDNIQFDYWNATLCQVTLDIAVEYADEGRLFISLRTLDTADHFVKNIEELRDELEIELGDIVYISKFRDLLGLDKENRENNTMSYDITPAPTIMPTEFFEHIKHCLDRLSAKKVGRNIRLSYIDSETGVVKAFLEISRKARGLDILVVDAQKRCRYIHSLEELDVFLSENVYDPIDELESLLGAQSALVDSEYKIRENP